MPSNSLSISPASSLNSMTPGAMTNMTGLLKEIIESWGWRDLSTEVYVAEAETTGVRATIKVCYQEELSGRT